MALGSGGGFGLWISSDLERGASAPCSTFGLQAPLGDGADSFGILRLQVWTFAEQTHTNVDSLSVEGLPSPLSSSFGASASLFKDGRNARADGSPVSSALVISYVEEAKDAHASEETSVHAAERFEREGANPDGAGLRLADGSSSATRHRAAFERSLTHVTPPLPRRGMASYHSPCPG